MVLPTVSSAYGGPLVVTGTPMNNVKKCRRCSSTSSRPTASRRVHAGGTRSLLLLQRRQPPQPLPRKLLDVKRVPLARQPLARRLQLLRQHVASQRPPPLSLVGPRQTTSPPPPVATDRQEPPPGRLCHLTRQCHNKHGRTTHQRVRKHLPLRKGRSHCQGRLCRLTCQWHNNQRRSTHQRVRKHLSLG